MRVPISLHPHQHLLLVVFLMVAILTGVRWNLTPCIFFMARDGEHFFMSFLTIWTSSLKRLCSVHLPISHWVIDLGAV
jgi:hypothetical protein